MPDLNLKILVLDESAERAEILLADHLAAGRLVAFSFSQPNGFAIAEEASRWHIQT